MKKKGGTYATICNLLIVQIVSFLSRSTLKLHTTCQIWSTLSAQKIGWCIVRRDIHCCFSGSISFWDTSGSNKFCLGFGTTTSYTRGQQKNPSGAIRHNPDPHNWHHELATLCYDQHTSNDQVLIRPILGRCSIFRIWTNRTKEIGRIQIPTRGWSHHTPTPVPGNMEMLPTGGTVESLQHLYLHQGLWTNNHNDRNDINSPASYTKEYS